MWPVCGLGFLTAWRQASCSGFLSRVLPASPGSHRPSQTRRWGHIPPALKPRHVRVTGRAREAGLTENGSATASLWATLSWGRDYCPCGVRTGCPPLTNCASPTPQTWAGPGVCGPLLFGLKSRRSCCSRKHPGRLRQGACSPRGPSVEGRLALAAPEVLSLGEFGGA